TTSSLPDLCTRRSTAASDGISLWLISPRVRCRESSALKLSPLKMAIVPRVALENSTAVSRIMLTRRRRLRSELIFFTTSRIGRRLRFPEDSFAGLRLDIEGAAIIGLHSKLRQGVVHSGKVDLHGVFMSPGPLLTGRPGRPDLLWEIIPRRIR